MNGNEFCSLLIKSDSKDIGRLNQLAEQQKRNIHLPRFAIVFGSSGNRIRPKKIIEHH